MTDEHARQELTSAGLTDWKALREVIVNDEGEVVQHRSRLLTQLRRGRGATQETVAEQMGVTQARVSAIEGNSLDATKVATLRKYVAALGGQLRIVVEFGGREVTILE